MIEEGNVYENISYRRDSNIKAWVNIQYGCDKFCTYCIVPYTRGKQRSRQSCEILKEVNRLKENGYKEVTLLGQNVNAYGKDLDDPRDFSDLLEEVAKTGIERIRRTNTKISIILFRFLSVFSIFKYSFANLSITPPFLSPTTSFYNIVQMTL